MSHEWDGIVPDKIISTPSKKYTDNYDKVFGKKVTPEMKKYDRTLCDVCGKDKRDCSDDNHRAGGEVAGEVLGDTRTSSVKDDHVQGGRLPR